MPCKNSSPTTQRKPGAWDEAGVPEGFALDLQVCSCSPSHMDLVPLLESYFAQVGLKTNIQTMEYASFLSAMTTKTHGPAYLHD